MNITTGDVIADGALAVTAVANPNTSRPRVSAVDDDGGVWLLRWDGAAWREETP